MIHVVHTIAPVYDKDATILILGSFPSVKSREGCFFYHHPRNRFWDVLSIVFNAPSPITVEEKRAFLLRHHIALWDVIKSCDIEASSDSSITNAEPNDILPILRAAPIRRIFTNGGTAFQLYNRYILPQSGISAEKLPSTSPANASFDLEKLVAAWKVIGES